MHGIGIEHNIDGESAVTYIPACHSIDINIRYVQAQTDYFKRGLAPQDYLEVERTCDEIKLKGHPSGVSLLSDARKRALPAG